MSQRKNSVLVLASSGDMYGANKILLQVIHSMDKMGLQPIVLVPFQGPLETELRQRNIATHVISLAVVRKRYLSVWGLFNRLKKFLIAIRYISALHKERRFDLVYSNTVSVWIGAIFSAYKGIRHVWHIHETPSSKSFIISFVAWLYRRSKSKGLCVSGTVRNFWKEVVDPATLSVVYNGIQHPAAVVRTSYISDELGLNRQKVVVGLIGRINQIKGQSFFIETIEHLVEMEANVTGLIIGDIFVGNEKLIEDLKSIVIAKKMQEHVFFLGQREDVDKIMESLDYLISCSTQPDSFPTVVLEAMGHQIPVIATDSGGTGEMLEKGKLGLMIPADDPKKAAWMIAEHMKDENQVSQMAIQARKKAMTSFSQRSFEHQMNTYLESIL